MKISKNQFRLNLKKLFTVNNFSIERIFKNDGVDIKIENNQCGTVYIIMRCEKLDLIITTTTKYSYSHAEDYITIENPTHRYLQIDSKYSGGNQDIYFIKDNKTYTNLEIGRENGFVFVNDNDKIISIREAIYDLDDVFF